jgi:hypothetical protein
MDWRKIDAVLDALRRPIRSMLTAGQVHDSHGARELLVKLETVVWATAPRSGPAPPRPVGYTQSPHSNYNW